MARKKGSDKPSEAELERRDVRFHAGLRVAERLAHTFLVCACITTCVYLGLYLPVKEAHGEVTTIRVIHNFLADVKANVVIGWTVGAAGGIYGWRMRKKLHQERGTKDARIRELEKRLDPHVTSSDLTPEGRDARR
ncbi:MAG TPA: hypothetical protein PK867_10435 [Pirellulales bacterium]|nr:hypothetical protein [Pirellulales bacterium]